MLARLEDLHPQALALLRIELDETGQGVIENKGSATRDV
jgi:hypothetical protein